jgi:hypothetical protein
MAILLYLVVLMVPALVANTDIPYLRIMNHTMSILRLFLFVLMVIATLGEPNEQSSSPVPPTTVTPSSEPSTSESPTCVGDNPTVSCPTCPINYHPDSGLSAWEISISVLAIVVIAIAGSCSYSAQIEANAIAKEGNDEANTIAREGNNQTNQANQANQANVISREGNNQANQANVKANAIAKESNDKAQEGNVIAQLSNVIAQEGNDISRAANAAALNANDNAQFFELLRGM